MGPAGSVMGASKGKKELEGGGERERQLSDTFSGVSVQAELPERPLCRP